MSATRPFLLINHFVLVMICLYLYVDALTGFVILELGIELKLSLLYKAPLIILMSVSLLLMDKKSFFIVMMVLVCFLVGAIRQVVLLANTDNFFLDFSFAVKLVTPLVTFLYLKALLTRLPHIFDKYISRALWFVVVAIAVNIFLGVLGFGFKTYGEGDSGLGTTGYFFAGNELGGLLILTYAFVLHYAWMKSKLLYIVVSLLCVFSGILVATKSASVAAILSVILIPILNERNLLLKVTKQKLAIFTFLIFTIPPIAYVMIDWLIESDLFARLSWAYDELGLWGLLLSGRQFFVVRLMDVYSSSQSVFAYVFGLGVSGVVPYVPKFSAEVDPIDTLVWFGFSGLSIISTMAIFFLYQSFKRIGDCSVVFCPAILLANMLLILAACLSGHIWTSGMLGISWALINALLYVKSENTRFVGIGDMPQRR